MPIGACSNGLFLTTVAVIILFPVHYYVPDLFKSEELVENEIEQTPVNNDSWVSLDNVPIPTFELLFPGTFLVLALFIYTCELIQRKLIERRIVKLNQYLSASVERLRAMDSQQEQLESTLKMVENATSEYNLLLYLLLRQRRVAPPASNCMYESELDDDLNSFRNT